MRNILPVILLSLALPALAGELIIYPTEDDFDDATFALESAIIGRGLNIDYVSHVGEMLARTKEDVGGTVDIFDAADIFVFCSARLSRQVMEVDPMNIMHCPYRVFVADQAGKVTIGFAAFPEGEMQVIQDLLDGIAREAAGL